MTTANKQFSNCFPMLLMFGPCSKLNVWNAIEDNRTTVQVYIAQNVRREHGRKSIWPGVRQGKINKKTKLTGAKHKNWAQRRAQNRSCGGCDCFTM